MTINHNHQDPNFYIHQMLGFPVEPGLNPTPISKQLHEERNEEPNGAAIEELSWVANGHPMGDSINGLDLSSLELGGLVRIAGGGAFGGVLHGQEALGLNCDPLQLVSDFLNELSENQQVCADYGLEWDDLTQISSGIKEACELAEKLRAIQSTADNEENAKDQMDQFALELKNLLDEKGVVHFPLLDAEGKYEQMVRVDKEHGFSVIRVEENPLGYLTNAESLHSKLVSDDVKYRQDCAAHTYLDPLTGREVEVFRSQQFISYSAKNFDRLGDENFFRALIKGSVLPAMLEGQDGADQGYDVEGLIHESLPAYVEGKRLKASDQKSELFRKMYRHFDEGDKDASFNSLSAALYYLSLNPFFNVEKDLDQAVLRYKKIKFLLQSQVFLAYVRRIDREGGWNEVCRSEKIFLDDLMHNLMRTAEKLGKIEGLTHTQLSGFFATCQQLKGIFERPVLSQPDLTVPQSEAVARAAVCLQLPSYRAADGALNVTLPPAADPFGLGGRAVGRGAAQDIEAQPAEVFISNLTTHHYQIDFSTDDLGEHLDGFLNNVQHLSFLYEELSADPEFRYRLNGSRYERAAKVSVQRAAFELYERTLQDVVASLPIPLQGDNCYWAKLPPELAEQWMNVTEQLSKLHFKFSILQGLCRSQRGSEGKHSADQSVLVLAIYAIQLQLASLDPEYRLDGQNFSYFNHLVEMRDTKFVIHNPSVRKMVSGLMHYFNPDWNVEEITRKFSKDDEAQLTSALFSFVERNPYFYETTTGWLTLEVKDSKKSADQKYFEKILDEEGVREGIIAVLERKNRELDQQHEEELTQYRDKLERYRQDKTAAQEQIVDLETQIEAITANLDEEAGNGRDWPEGLDELQRTLVQCRQGLSGLQEPIKPEHPGRYPTDSVIDQLCCLLCDEEGRAFIPEKVNRILQNALRSQYFTSNHINRMVSSEDELVSFCFDPPNWGPRSLENQSRRMPINCVIKTDERHPRLLVDRIVVGSKSSAKYLVNPNSSSEGWIYQQIRSEFHGYPNQNEIMASNKTVADLDPGKSRELRMLAIDPYDTVSRTIGFFRENINLLSRSDAREFIETLLFRPDFLHSQLRDNPQIAEKMNAFILSAVQHYKEIKDIETCMAMIRLGDQFKRAAREAMGDDSAFSDYRSVILNAIIPTFNKDNAAKLRAYRTLMILHAHNDVLRGGNGLEAAKKQAVQDLLALRVCVQLQSHPMPLSAKDEALIATAVLRYQSLLDTVVEDVDLTNAVKVALQDERLNGESRWEEDENQKGVYSFDSYTIDVKTGVVCSNGTPVVVIPNWITGNETLQRVYPFSFDSHTCVRRNDWTYVLYPDDPEKQLEIRSYDNGDTVEIIRLIDGDAYRYVPTPRELIASMPTVFDQSTVCWELNGRILACQNDEPAYAINFERGRGNEHAIQSIERLRDGMIAQNFTTKVLDLGFPLLDQLPDGLNISKLTTLFKGFPVGESNSNNIECWMKPDGSKILVDFRKLGLSFELFPEEIQSVVREKISAVLPRFLQLDPNNPADAFDTILKIFDQIPVHSLNFPGFSYTIPELMQSLILTQDNTAVPYFTLRSKSGDLKVLVPNVIDRVLGRAINERGLNLQALNLDDFIQEQPLEWIDFSVKTVKSNGMTHFDIDSNEVHNQLFLLLLNAAQKDFGKMLEILKKINPLEGFSEEENRILSAVLATLHACNHPEANAISLKLNLIKHNNLLKYPKHGTGNGGAIEQDQALSLENMENAALLIAYDRYRENIGKTSKFRITDEEERQVLEHLHSVVTQYLSSGNVTPVENEGSGFVQQLVKKAARWLYKTFGTTCLAGIAEQRMGARYDALSKGGGKLGTRTVNWLTERRDDWWTPFTSGNEIVELFTDCMEDEDVAIRIPDEETVKGCLGQWIKDQAYWHQHFVTLYYIARSGSKDQRSRLKEELDLTTHLRSPEHSIISWVLAKPGRYPTVEKINQKLHGLKGEYPQKIEAAQNEAAQKRVPFEQAASDYERSQRNLDDLQAREGQLLGDFASIKDLRGGLQGKQRELNDARNNKKYLLIQKLEREIAQIDQSIRSLEELQPRLAEAGREARGAKNALDAAERVYNKAQFKVEKETGNFEKKEAELRALVSSISPDSRFFGKIWVLIDRHVKPLFRKIGQVWKAYWSGRKFFNNHIYPVRDIFSSGAVSRTNEMMHVDSQFLVEMDAAFDSYLNQHVETYFDLFRMADADREWAGRDGGDPLIEAKLQEEKIALDQYRQELRVDRVHASLKDGVGIQDLQNDLEEKIQALNVSLVNQKETLVWHLNREIESNSEAQLLKQINRLGQKGQLTWDDLRSLTLTGNMAGFREKTGLSEVEAKRLLQGVGEYLVKATRLNQLRSVLQAVKRAESAESEGKKGIYYTNIVEALALKRRHTPDLTNLAKLWSEYSNQYMYRENQIALLEKTAPMSEDEILVQAPTGFGKSKNYVPAMDYEISENRLVFNVHPSTIEWINAHDVQSQMRDCYGRKADRLDFQRSTQFSTATLKKLYEDLQVNFEEKRPINCSAETLQALELHFQLAQFDCVNMMNSPDSSKQEIEKIQEQIGYFIRILRAISVYGWATIDESHRNLNPFSNKLIYTIGDPSILELYQVELLEEMMDWLVTDDQICDIVRIQANQQARVTEEQYGQVSRIMAEKYAEKYRISDEKREEFIQFVLGQLDAIPSWIRQNSHAKKYALIKGVLSMILKSCMDGYVDENFGLSKLHSDTKEYAIAYSSSNTPKENEQTPSQFKNPHETMIKTYFTYLHKGLSEEQVVKMLKIMQSEQLQERMAGQSLADTQTNRAFVEIAGEGHSLQELSETDMKRLYKDFKHSKEAIFYYIKRIVVPQLKLYDKTLVSTPQNLRSMFGSSVSLSATPQDPATHGPDTTMVPMPGTYGQVSHLFLNKVDTGQKIHVSSSSDPKEVMSSAINTVLENSCMKCIIDAGGLMRGLSNEFIAEALREEILQRGSDIQAIQYFDVQLEDFVMMEIESGSLSDPSVSKLPPSKVITVFDQPRCFGSDTKQDETASALLLVNNRIDKATAGQGAGRMRQWHLDQGIEVMMTPEDYEYSFSGREANIGDLLTLWISNLAKQEAKENYQALLQQMDNELRRSALDRMLGIRSKDRKSGEDRSMIDREPDVNKALKLFRKFEPLFVIDDSCDPWRLYAEMPTDTSPSESLDEHLNSSLKNVEKIRGFSSKQRMILKKRLMRYSRRWNGAAPDRENPDGVRPVSLPEKVKSSKIDTGTQVEVQVQTEVEVEQEVEEMIWENQFVRTPSKWPDQIQLFKPGWERAKSQNVFLTRLANTLSKLEPRKPVLKFAFRALLIIGGSALAATAAAVAGLALPIVSAIGNTLATFGLGYMLYKLLIGRNVKFIPNCAYKVRDVMDIYLPKDVRKGAKIFSSNLTVSNNYYALRTPGWKQPAQLPFTQEQKPVFNVLVIQDRSSTGGKSLQMMLIDQNDSIYFRRRLQADYETVGLEEAEARTRKIAVYDVTNGLIAVQGKNQFDAGELEDNPQFVSLLTQAKLINGEVNYSEEEKDVIAALGQPIGKEKMHEVEGHFLQNHPIKRALYEKTDLCNAIEAISE